MVYLQLTFQKNLRFFGGLNPSTGVTWGDRALAWSNTPPEATNGLKKWLENKPFPLKMAPFCREHMLVLGAYISNNRSKAKL